MGGRPQPRAGAECGPFRRHAIGLISDLAVGTDGGGSQAWSRQADMLIGLSVGAPPDLLNGLGQNWGLSAFSPRALARSGFSAFREMIVAAMAHAGGVAHRSCHGAQAAMGGAGRLRRHGRCLYRLSVRGPHPHRPRWESHRHRAIVIGEDLGTVPEGFREVLAARGILGMKVLWFERHADGGFYRRAALFRRCHCRHRHP